MCAVTHEPMCLCVTLCPHPPLLNTPWNIPLKHLGLLVDVPHVQLSAVEKVDIGTMACLLSKHFYIGFLYKLLRDYFAKPAFWGRPEVTLSEVTMHPQDLRSETDCESESKTKNPTLITEISL